MFLSELVFILFSEKLDAVTTNPNMHRYNLNELMFSHGQILLVGFLYLTKPVLSFAAADSLGFQSDWVWINMAIKLSWLNVNYFGSVSLGW